MAITNSDVKLFESQCLTGEEDGGGRVTGALLVQEGQFNYERPIVLSGNGEAGWVSRLTVKSLFALSKAANKTMTLTLPDNRQFSVIFDRSNGIPIE